ncbi:MAG: hypothetical protein MZV63_56595, partial [Marinilabiliales bacterium]|nr:hypothetical protein [Marinilabiliales bacterium]
PTSFSYVLLKKVKKELTQGTDLSSAPNVARPVPSRTVRAVARPAARPRHHRRRSGWVPYDDGCRGDLGPDPGPLAG